MAYPHGQPVTVERPTWTTDAYGNQVRESFSPVGSLPAAVAPLSPAELTELGRQGVEVDLALYCDDPDADIAAHDRITTGGAIYEAVGEPERWRSPFSGWAAGARILIKRIEG